MASTLNDNNAANNSILEANHISELDSSKVGANTVLGSRMFNLQAKIIRELRVPHDNRRHGTSKHGRGHRQQNTRDHCSKRHRLGRHAYSSAVT